MLQYVKTRTAEEQRQVVPCRAGTLSAVIHANGDVGVCEQRPPIGNLRERSFREIWQDRATYAVRKSIKNKECYCTNEIFMWPSIVFQPPHLARSLMGARAWEKVEPLAEGDRADYSEDISKMEIPPQRDAQRQRKVLEEWEQMADAR
jgi:hypothetical protein